MKVAVEANMINEGETSIYQNWLLPLLKFNWQRMYDTLRTYPRLTTLADRAATSSGIKPR